MEVLHIAHLGLDVDLNAEQGLDFDALARVCFNASAVDWDEIGMVSDAYRQSILVHSVGEKETNGLVAQRKAVQRNMRANGNYLSKTTTEADRVAERYAKAMIETSQWLESMPFVSPNGTEPMVSVMPNKIRSNVYKLLGYDLLPDASTSEEKAVYRVSNIVHSLDGRAVDEFERNAKLLRHLLRMRFVERFRLLALAEAIAASPPAALPSAPAGAATGPRESSSDSQTVALALNPALNIPIAQEDGDLDDVLSRDDEKSMSVSQSVSQIKGDTKTVKTFTVRNFTYVTANVTGIEFEKTEYLAIIQKHFNAIPLDEEAEEIAVDLDLADLENKLYIKGEKFAFDFTDSLKVAEVEGDDDGNAKKRAQSQNVAMLIQILIAESAAALQTIPESNKVILLATKPANEVLIDLSNNHSKRKSFLVSALIFPSVAGDMTKREDLNVIDGKTLNYDTKDFEFLNLTTLLSDPKELAKAKRMLENPDTRWWLVPKQA